MTREVEFHRPAVVLCDFDGTMTTEDIIHAVWRRFAKDGWQQTVQEVLAQRQTLRNGLAQVFGQIPASLAREIAEYATQVVRFRPGLEEFLRFCQEQRLDFVVASGGIDFFVLPILEHLRPWLREVYTIPADLSGETIHLHYPHGCETCGMCKAKVAENFPNHFRIIIGDSISDLHGALHADLVFARDHLKHYLDDHEQPYEPFETFHDIQRTLKRSYLGTSGQSHAP
jgi:2-hydroxy-3-keto-5-methylthiopentenyl-1-phosphate phosphatase